MFEKTIDYIGIILALTVYTLVILLICASFHFKYQSIYKHNICIDVLNLNGTIKATGEYIKVLNVEEVCDKYSNITNR